MSRKTAILIALSAACLAAPAIASSDYLLQLPPEKGEASPPIAVESWSFGVCNAGQCSSGTAAKGAKPNRASWDLATGKGGSGAAAASYAKSGITRIDSTPARISTNMSTGREAARPSVSERCISGSCDALTDGLLIMRFTGGQMKHTKTGHVTLLK